MLVELKKISIVLSVIIFSYLIVSKILNDSTFYYFDASWRVAIILWIFTKTKVRLNFSLSQWRTLFLIVAVEAVLYYFLAPDLTFVRATISILLAPVAEELLFRGWIMDEISGTNKQRVILSSVLFSLYHLKNAFVLTTPALLYQLLIAGVVAGPLLAWLKIRYKSLFFPIVVHSALFNTLGDTITPKIFPVIVERNTT